ncbi:MAG: outer membrane protein assembly factor BamE [Gammaproteobacteria bacterium]|jgi:outer membrane protein assembly factor BamE
MMRKILIPCLIFYLGLAAGCSVYRPNLQQGNILSTKAVDQLKPGMSRNQVIYVMGTPLLEDPFHKNRWDYIHTVKNGKTQVTTIQRLTLYFENGKLSRIDKSGLKKRILKN